jgi:hypothetical protein
MARSGTTALAQLVGSHPEIRVGLELGAFIGLERSPIARRGRLLDLWRRQPLVLAPLLTARGHGAGAALRIAGHRIGTYATLLARAPQAARSGPPDLRLQAVLRAALGDGRVMGDGHHEYLWQLPELLRVPGLQVIMAYRDGRDVVSSTLRRVRTTWRGRAWIGTVDTARKVAERWVRAIELMELYAGDVLAVRYEELMSDPGSVLATIAGTLDVEAAGFRSDLLHRRSVGKHRSLLTADELADVEDVAGPTLARHGYT